MKKRFKIKYGLYGCCLFLAAFLAGCYEDKGDYNYEDWTALLSVSGVEIPGSAYGSVTLAEGDTLRISPVVQFKEGVNPDDFDYYWVMGGDTIGTGLKLCWEITQTNIQFDPSDQKAFVWLDITNRLTGESWKHYPVDVFPGGGTYYTVKVKISPTAIPKIGVLVYEKTDGTLEWGSVKGANPAMPENFKTLYTDMYDRYNQGKKIYGSFAGATFIGSELDIYTQSAPDYGVMIQTSTEETYPFGKMAGTIRENTLMSDPVEKIRRKYSCYDGFQEILIGTTLFVSPADSYYPYQLVEPNAAGTESDVAQIVSALPDTRQVLTHVQLTTSGEVYYYTNHSQMGYYRVPLLNADGKPLKLDKITGLFCEPVLEYASGQKIKFFMIGKTGNTYRMYVYSIQGYSSGNNVVAYLKEKDVTHWGGGISDDVIWFTTATPVGWNYAYFTKGNDLWRFGFESLDEPVVAKSFDASVVCVQPAIKNWLIGYTDEDYYTAIFTYNASSGNGSMYAVDTRTENVKEFSSCRNAVPGKVLVYLPYLSSFK